MFAQVFFNGPIVIIGRIRGLGSGTCSMLQLKQAFDGIIGWKIMRCFLSSLYKKPSIHVPPWIVRLLTLRKHMTRSTGQDCVRY